MMVGVEKVDGGKIVVGDTINIGYYTQSGMNLKEDHRVIDVIRNIAEYIPMHKGQKLTAVQLCERFLFDAKKQQNFVSKLSGGERRRLYLLTIIMKNPNFLILDEPTNDLDIMTLQVLEEFLQGFPGCIVIVSHDRHFMDKIVEHTFVLEGDGLVRDFPGNYSAYRAVAKQEAIEAKAEEKELAVDQPVVKTASKISQEERKELKRLERQISKIEEQKVQITAQFNDTSLTPAQITELSKKLNQLGEDLEEKEMRWMELVDEFG
jgi:ATP-binding cassette subfamily F protein uup